MGNKFFRFGGELRRDGIRLTRDGIGHGWYLWEVGAFASRKSILAEQGHRSIGRAAVDFEALDATPHHGVSFFG